MEYGQALFGTVGKEFGDIVLWIVFFCALMFFSVMSIIMLYHWKKYEIRTKRAWYAIVGYFVVSLLILLGMFFALWDIVYNTNSL